MNIKYFTKHKLAEKFIGKELIITTKRKKKSFKIATTLFRRNTIDFSDKDFNSFLLPFDAALDLYKNGEIILQKDFLYSKNIKIEIVDFERLTLMEIIDDEQWKSKMNYRIQIDSVKRKNGDRRTNKGFARYTMTMLGDKVSDENLKTIAKYVGLDVNCFLTDYKACCDLINNPSDDPKIVHKQELVEDLWWMKKKRLDGEKQYKPSLFKKLASYAQNTNF